VAIIYPVENYALSLGIKHDSCWGHEDGNYEKAKPLLNTLGLQHIDRNSEFLIPDWHDVLVQTRYFTADP
jgi:hypothetical protein